VAVSSSRRPPIRMNTLGCRRGNAPTKRHGIGRQRGLGVDVPPAAQLPGGVDASVVDHGEEIFGLTQLHGWTLRALAGHRGAMRMAPSRRIVSPLR
jgi:hypothetical protein